MSDAGLPIERPLLPGVRGGLGAAQIYAILRRRVALIAAITVGLALGSLVISLLMTPVYEAEATMMIDFQSSDPVTGQDFPQMLSDSYVATQIDLLHSVTVRRAAVEALKLTDDPQARKAYERADVGDMAFADWLAAGMRDHIAVEKSRESRILSVRYTDSDRRQAANIANALVRVFRETKLELAQEPARDRRQKYEKYLSSLRGDVDQAQEKLTGAQQDLGVLDLDNTGRADAQRLADLGVRLNAAESDSQAAHAKVRRIEALKRQGKPLTAQADILGSAYVQELKGRLVQLQSSRADLGETLGSRHPQMQSINAEIATVRRQLSGEIGAYVQANRGEARSSQERESALRKSVSGERRSMLDEQRKRDQIAGHVRALESAKAVYQAAVDRYDQVLGSSQLQNVNVSVIHWASAPQHPVRPNTLRNVLAGLVLGLMLGVFIALVLELSNRRVRTQSDVERELDLEVLGVIPR